MIKFKWTYPFFPFAGAILTDPHFFRPIEERVLAVFGTLLFAVIMLVIIKPWDISAEQAKR